ncbi:MAG: response regulator, partial [Rhodovulum sp.]
MRVLIVDDSALMRRWLKECLSSEPDMDCAVARDGQDALAKIASFDPDVVTLDINMPVMDGLSCLAQIMEDTPRPVVMVSSLTESGALATFEALELGAVDFIAKPGGTVSQNLRTIFPDLVAKVR